MESSTSNRKQRDNHSKKGRTYPIVVEYFEESGGEALILGWQSEKLSKRLISSKYLETKDGEAGLKGTYFKNKNLNPDKNKQPIIRIDKELNWVTGGGWGNNEAQYYTDRPKNVRVENGRLIIEALKEDFYGSKYTSSRIKTKNSWKYGRFQIRAKLPKGVGTWAAFGDCQLTEIWIVAKQW